MVRKAKITLRVYIFMAHIINYLNTTYKKFSVFMDKKTYEIHENLNPMKLIPTWYNDDSSASTVYFTFTHVKRIDLL